MGLGLEIVVIVSLVLLATAGVRIYSDSQIKADFESHISGLKSVINAYDQRLQLYEQHFAATEASTAKDVATAESIIVQAKTAIGDTETAVQETKAGISADISETEPVLRELEQTVTGSAAAASSASAYVPRLALTPAKVSTT